MLEQQTRLSFYAVETAADVAPADPAWTIAVGSGCEAFASALKSSGAFQGAYPACPCYLAIISTKVERLQKKRLYSLSSSVQLQLTGYQDNLIEGQREWDG